MPINLSVNLNAIAMLRNRRMLPWPDILHFAQIALQAGAQGITVHPRPDQRHIRYSDIPELSYLMRRHFPRASFNIEGYPSAEFLEIALPHADQLTLVPDSPEQRTSDHGWDFVYYRGFLASIMRKIKAEGKKISLFSDPCADAIDIIKELGADSVEFYTGPYAFAYDNAKQQQKELEKLARAASEAQSYGLAVHAGHDLTIDNLPALVKAIPHLREVSIGHALTADALEYGMAGSVGRFLNILGHFH